MKVKLDENLPVQLASALSERGHDVHTVRDEGLVGRDDREIWEAARRESRFLITQDLDFSDLRKFRPGLHQGILVIRLRSPSRRNSLSRIAELFETEAVGEWGGCFIAATERKLRVLKAESKKS